MAGEAVVRVKLDSGGAKAELDALFAHGAKGVRVPVSGAPGAGGPAGGGGFMGTGWSMSSILGTVGIGATLGRATLRDSASIGEALTSRLSEGLSKLLFGEAGPASRGAMRAREEVEAQMGLARGLGIASKEDAQGLYEALRPLREAEEKGKQAIRSETPVEEAAVKGLLQRIADACEAVARFLNVGG